MKNRNYERKGLAIGIIVLYLGLIFHPIGVATPTIVSPFDSNDSDFVEVMCQLWTFGGIRQVVKEIPKYRLEKITALANEAYNSLGEKLSIIDMRQKFIALADELKHAKLLPQRIDVDDVANLIMSKVLISQQFLAILNNLQIKNTIDNDSPNDNYFSFVFGTGNMTMSIRLITGGVCDYLFAIYANFGLEFFYKLTMFCMFRPKAWIGFGFWQANEGGNITTVGLKGIKRWSADEQGIGVVLLGFLGLVVTPRYNLDNTGFIIGFSFGSVPITFIP